MASAGKLHSYLSPASPLLQRHLSDIESDDMPQKAATVNTVGLIGKSLSWKRKTIDARTFMGDNIQLELDELTDKIMI
jgi:bacillopeptidase F (M6 metalloprotease family)